MEQLHLLISGLVQGVGFRVSTQRKAVQLGLTGWVRNTMDGKVETLAEGSTEKVEAFLAWCKHGPPSSKVMDVKILKRELTKTSPQTSFEII